MSRDFDGSDDDISFGDIGDPYTDWSTAAWWDLDDVTADDTVLTNKHAALRLQLATSSVLQLAIAGGSVNSAGSVSTGLNHLGATFSESNDRGRVYRQGSQDGENTGLTGTIADNANPLEIGANTFFAFGYVDGRCMAFVSTDAEFTAADINRHKWWGVAPGGPSTVEVWYPFWTSDLNNKGTLGGSATLNVPVMAALPRVERCWGSLMGVGR